MKNKQALTASIFWLGVVFAINLSGVLVGQEAKLFDGSRIWTDDSGKHNVNARLVGYEEGQVTLRKSDNSEIKVSIDTLSSADREYLDRLSRAVNLASKEAQNSSDEQSRQIPVPADRKDLESQEKYGINWYNIDDSFVVAKAENKPIMWFRVLGDLNGFM